MIMKPENEMNEEVRQLLESLEAHGKNARRQKDLEELIDGLSGAATQLDRTKTIQVGLLRSARNDGQRKLYPVWWLVGAAAAVLLLWLMVRPSLKQTPDVHEEILVEETRTMDTIKTEVKDEVKEVILEEPIVVPVIAREETRRVHRPKQPNLNDLGEGQVGLLRPEGLAMTELDTAFHNNDVAEVIPVESLELIDTTNVGSNTISTENETPLTVQKPQRRVVRSLNLVCYECQMEPEIWNKEIAPAEKTLFNQPQDPNMKNGSLAFEFKRN